MKQLNEKEAITFAQSNVYENWTDEQIVRFQLFQKKLCLSDFGIFKKAMSTVLDRPVYTHEFVDTKSLISEYLGEKEPPTLEEIINLIPKDKRILLQLSSDQVDNNGPKHTQGKWEITGYAGEHDEAGAAIKCNGEFICTTSSVKAGNWQEYYANARVIENAPELLRTLEYLLDSLESGKFILDEPELADDICPEEWQDKAEKLVAKINESIK